MLYIYIYVITLFPSNSLFRYIRYSVKASIYIQENYKYKPKKIYHSGKSRHKHWAKFKTGSFSQVKPVYFPKPVCRPQFGRQGGIQHRINRFSPSASPSWNNKSFATPYVFALYQYFWNSLSLSLSPSFSLSVDELIELSSVSIFKRINYKFKT